MVNTQKNIHFFDLKRSWRKQQDTTVCIYQSNTKSKIIIEQYSVGIVRNCSRKLEWIHIHFKKCRQFISADPSRWDVLLSETTEAELWWVRWSWKWDVFSAIIIVIKCSCNDNLNLCSKPPSCSSTLDTFVPWRLRNKLISWLCYKEKLCLTRQMQPYFILMILPSMEHKRSNW